MTIQTERLEAGVVPAFDLADRLRKSLRFAGISVQDMADELELERSTIGRYINGRGKPNAATLRVWAMHTGVSFHWLRDGEAPATGEGDGGFGPTLPRKDLNLRPSGYGFVLVTPLPHRTHGAWELAA